MRIRITPNTDTFYAFLIDKLLKPLFPIYFFIKCPRDVDEHTEIPAGNYTSRVNNQNTRTRCEMCSKLVSYCQRWTYFTPCSSVFIVNFEQANANWKVPFDATTLYTSITHEALFLEALDNFLTTYYEDLDPRFKKEFVLESAKFILKYNALIFDFEFYLQIKATLATLSTTTYANLNIGYYEIKVYSIIHHSYAVASKYFKNSWFIFLEDCQI